MPRHKYNKRGPKLGNLSQRTGRNKGRNKPAPTTVQAIVAMATPDAPFTMRDEARNTAHNNRIWDRDAKLRDCPVEFVSAGAIQPIKLLEDDEEEETEEAHLLLQAEETVPGDLNRLEDRNAPAPKQHGPPTLPGQGLTRQIPSRPASSGPTRESADETDSGAEVIIFRGRNKNRRGRGAKPSSCGWMEESKGGETEREQQRREKQEEEEAVINDYIANMAADSDQDTLEGAAGLASSSFAKRDLGHDMDDPEDQSSCPESDGAESGSKGDDSNDDSGNAVEMDDETLARLLAKQDELGLDTDDVMLYDGAVDIRPRKNQKTGTQMRAGAKKFTTEGGQYPNATLLAEALEEFELDSGPSLIPPKRKGRKGQPPPFAVEDSDIEAALAMAWQKDRLAKKEKKAQREELRARGLLGNNLSPDDMRIKYPHGIRIGEIKEELRVFLIGSNESISFPPMDTHGRKTVHILAHKLKLKSKSAGAGDSRHPVVYRTKATPKYNPVTFDSTIIARGRPFFPRPDVEGAGAKMASFQGQGSGHAGLRYRDGEVVSASVPQIAQGNKGRTMLEKMGWSHGTALGADNNKGILEPVIQVVKTTKAGLGTAGRD